MAGVVAEHRAATVRIRARRAVHLGAGGFARNEAMRLRHHPHPITGHWTSAHLGDGLTLGAQAGGATRGRA